MNRSLGLKSILGVGVTAVAVTAAVAVGQATGESAPKVPEVPRAEAYLASTQAELEGSQHSVGTVRLDLQVDGREIYVLRGEDTRCVLVADASQAAGRSQSIACSDVRSATPEKPLHAGFPLKSGHGYVDLVWTDGAAAKAAVSGVPVEVRAGANVTAAVRPDDSEGSTLNWDAADGTSVREYLPSRSERDARNRAPLAAAKE